MKYRYNLYFPGQIVRGEIESGSHEDVAAWLRMKNPAARGAAITDEHGDSRMFHFGERPEPKKG